MCSCSLCARTCRMPIAWQAANTAARTSSGRTRHYTPAWFLAASPPAHPQSALRRACTHRSSMPRVAPKPHPGCRNWLQQAQPCWGMLIQQLSQCSHGRQRLALALRCVARKDVADSWRSIQRPHGHPRAVTGINEWVVSTVQLGSRDREPHLAVDDCCCAVVAPALDVVHRRGGDAALSLLHNVDGGCA